MAKIIKQKYNSITFYVLLCQCISISTVLCTRIPLEVYELTANVAQTTARTITTIEATNFNNEENQQQQQQQQQQHYLLKHKNLEYAIIETAQEHKTFNNNNNNNNSNVSSNSSVNSESDINSKNNSSDVNSQIPLDRRRSSRQMYKTNDEQEMLQQHQLQQIQQQQQQQQYLNNYQNAAVSLYLQQLYQHHQQLHQQQSERHKQFKDSNNSNKKSQQQQNHDVIDINGVTTTVHGKPVRILYQVGESEEDLPICAANAVCSKIDLYETPWIERQCRCPDPNRIMHYHYNVNNRNKDDAIEIITTEMHAAQSMQQQQQQQTQHLSHAEKMRNYYEQEKMLQHNKRSMLVGDFNDKKFESLHFKKLMQKLGAVYEDDLHIQPNDYLAGDHEDSNDALPALEEIDEYENNEYASSLSSSSSASPVPTSKTHMRHSGHLGHKVKDISFIGGCPSSLGIEDGHTIADKTRHYKLCQPVHKLPICKHFRDYTWTLTTSNELNVTEQIVHCRCPKNSVTYLTKREPAENGLNGYTYLFACSPLTRIRCQRKQPCKLFTVRKRQELLDEVNINALCQCPKGHHCPSHHTQSGVIAGESFLEDNIQTYSGYCMAND